MDAIDNRKIIELIRETGRLEEYAKRTASKARGMSAVNDGQVKRVLARIANRSARTLTDVDDVNRMIFEGRG